MIYCDDSMQALKNFLIFEKYFLQHYGMKNIDFAIKILNSKRKQFSAPCDWAVVIWAECDLGVE